MDWLSEKELTGFKSVGKNVLISRHAVIYGRENVSIGDNVRIDAFCLIQAASGWLTIGHRVHIAARTTLLCSGGIEISDYAQIATNCTLLSASDDFSGNYLIGPMVPDEYRFVKKDTIHIRTGAVVGAHCVVLPGTSLGIGAALGAISLASGSYEGLAIYTGIPARGLWFKRRDIEFLKQIEEIEAGTGKPLDSSHISDIDRDLPKKN